MMIICQNDSAVVDVAMLLILHNQHSLLSKLLQSPELTTLSRFSLSPSFSVEGEANQTICETRKKGKVDFDHL